MTEPFFFVKTVNGAFEVSGATRCSLGHQLPPGDSGQPEGVFARWSWEGGRFHLQNDRLGYFPLFYFVRGGELGVSTSILKLLELGAPKEYDDTALAVFVRLGYFLGEDTPFRFIRAVPANCSFEWKDGNLQVSGHQDHGKHIIITREEAVDGYIALFRKAIQRRLVPNQDFALPLSGGRDSRHTLLELCRAGQRPVSCVTFRHFPPRNDSDVEIASLLSRRFGIRHVILDQPKSLLKTELAKNKITSFCSDEHAQYIVLADYLKDNVRVVYDGIGIGLLTTSRYLIPERLEAFRRHAFTKLAQNIIPQRSEGVLKALLSAQAYKRFSWEAAISRLAEELQSFADSPNPPGAFHFWCRTRREVSLAPFRIFDRIPVVLAPFLDHGLCDFLLSLPAEMLLDRQLQPEAIQKAFPDVADVPYETKNSRVFSPAHFKRYARDLFEFAGLKRSCNLIRRSYLLPRLVWCQFSGEYLADAAFWLLKPLAAFLIQIDRVVEGNAT